MSLASIDDYIEYGVDARLPGLAYGREWFERARESGSQEHQTYAKLFEGRVLRKPGATERAHNLRKRILRGMEQR